MKEKISYEGCPVTYCMSVIGGKWKTIILFLVYLKINRFGIMHRSINGISKQMLTTQLRELEKDGLLKRKIYAEIPPKVEYFLTKKGESIMPIIETMKTWGEKNMKIKVDLVNTRDMIEKKGKK